MDAELEQFKRSIDLVAFAEHYGYRVVAKESSKSSKVMVSETGDKIVIKTANYGIWFGVHSNRSGTIIDFLQYQSGCSLGEIRQVLRHWLRDNAVPGATSAAPGPTSAAPGPTLWEQWQAMKPIGSDNGYLAYRGLSREIVAAFSARIRVDARGNVCFRHDDRAEIVGYEIKNRGFTGYSSGGKKALFAAPIGVVNKEYPRVVITESAIDSMSYYQLRQLPGLYISFAGAISHSQESLLLWVLQRFPSAHVIIATDNDSKGDEYARMISVMRSDAERDRPTRKDWNDVLMKR